MHKPILMCLSMGLERFVQNPDDRKIKKIKLATQMLSGYIFELYTCVRVQKCDKNMCIHTLAPGGRPRCGVPNMS
jgi:hypothetical protein